MRGMTSVDEIRLMMIYRSSGAVKGVTMENKHTMSDLYQMQSLPLSAKISMTAHILGKFTKDKKQLNILERSKRFEKLCSIV